MNRLSVLPYANHHSGQECSYTTSKPTCAWTIAQKVSSLHIGSYRLIDYRQGWLCPISPTPSVNDYRRWHSQVINQLNILCCRNDNVDSINQEILDIFPGEEVTVHSNDRASDPDEGIDHSGAYPVEFLDSLVVLAGLPLLAHLKLKQECPLMLLWNLDPSVGLCNGVRLILMEMWPWVLKCCILGGKFAGMPVFIPHITLKPSDQTLPIPFSWHQFPVQLAFAMTVNKSQVNQSSIWPSCACVFSWTTICCTVPLHLQRSYQSSPSHWMKPMDRHQILSIKKFSLGLQMVCYLTSQFSFVCSYNHTD